MAENRQSLLRRNGKPQSCEPYRKSKIKCDHAQPVCGRCSQRKIEYRCEYHPAPLTRQSRPHEWERPIQQHAPPIQTISAIGSEPSEWIGPGLHVHRPSPDAEKAAGDHAAGYLGPTSYSAIFAENKLGNSTEDFGHQTTNSIFQEYDIANPPASATCDLEAQEHVDQGIRVLKRFPGKALCERLIDRYFYVCDVLIPEPVLRHVHTSTWSSHGDCISQPGQGKDDGLSKVSKALCKTAMTPIGLSTNTNEWLESFTGKNLRWEIVGNLFALFGVSIMSMSDWDPIFATANDGSSCSGGSKRQYAGIMRECAEACLALCNDVDAVNDFVVSLMASIYCLQSFYEGDASTFRLGRSTSMVDEFTECH